MSKGNEWELLSDRLISEVEVWDFEKRKEETDDERENRKFVEKLVHVLLSSFESFSEKWVSRVHEIMKHEKIWLRAVVDEAYSVQVVRMIPNIVEKFLRLDPVLVSSIPHKDVALYLREATKCYLFGFSQASVALSRAAVELGLDAIFRAAGKTPDGFLEKKLKVARRESLIDEESFVLADDVRTSGKAVLHIESVSDEVAFKVLTSARGALIRFYGG